MKGIPVRQTGGLESGKPELEIDREFPLSEAAAAHSYLGARKTKGKVLVIPSRSVER